MIFLKTSKTMKVRGFLIWIGMPLLTGVLCGIGLIGCDRDPTVQPTDGMGHSESQWIRVLLFDKLRECTVSVTGSLTVLDQSRQVIAQFTTDQSPFDIQMNKQQIQIGDHLLGQEILLQTHSPHLFTINDRPYRGNLLLSVRPDQSGFYAINQIPLEEYLCGVIGAEMQSYWEPEALKAQAVASRTYALFIRHRFGRNRLWDLRANQAHQVYFGVLAETPTTREAVFNTRGLVLVCLNKDGNKHVFPTYYSSACGGHTVDSRKVFGDSYPALCGVKCPWCKDVTRSDFFYWTPVSYSIEAIEKCLMKRYSSLSRLEKIEAIEVAQQTPLGRITSVRLKGPNNQNAFVRGEDFRLSLDPTGRKIRSAVFSLKHNSDEYEFFDGKGFGHGVGMCQSGVQGMARKEKSFQRILDYYYPNSQLVRIQARDNGSF